MNFVKVVDANRKHWVLNTAHIVAVAPTWGEGAWSRGAQILLDRSAYESGHINIDGDAVAPLLQQLGLTL